MTRPPLRARAARLVLVALSASAFAIVGAPPAAARVAAISPSSATVDAGGGASAAVTIESDRVSCPSVRTSSGAVDASLDPLCSDGGRITLHVSTDSDIAPGTYSVRVEDAEGGQTFLLRVRDPAPPPPPPTTAAPTTTTTTTTRSTTTTAPARTTTSRPAPTTTAAPVPPPVSEPAPEPEPAAEPPTTEVPPTPVAPGEAFVGVAARIAAGLPVDGLFVPLRDRRFLTCLPLRAVCGDGAIAVVPARTSQVRWVPAPAPPPAAAPPPAETPPPADGAAARIEGTETTFTAVGAAPADVAAGFRLPVLDLSSGEARRTTVAAVFGPTGRLVAAGAAAPDGAGAPLVPVVEGPFAPAEAAAEASVADAGLSPFDRPRSARSTLFTEASPALVVLPGGGHPVLQAIVPDEGWDTGVDLLPLFDERALPYLVRGVEGPAGLFLPMPAGVTVPPLDQSSAAAEPDDGSSASPLLLLAGVLAAGVAVTVVTARRRRLQ